MGQMVSAVVLGVPLKGKLAAVLYNDEGNGLLDGDDLEGVGRLDTDEDGQVIGIALALSGGGDDGDRLFGKPFKLSAVAKEFRSEMKDAKQRWAFFKKALAAKLKETKAKGVTLPVPELYLMQVERA
jgi:hypothetical protein